MPVDRDVDQRRRDGRALDRRLPAARRQRADRLPARRSTSCSTRPSGCSASTGTPFDARPTPTSSATGWPPSSTPAGRRRAPRAARCRSRCTGGRTAPWSGRARTSSSATSPAPTRTSPSSTRRWSRRVLVEDGRAVGVVVRDLRDGSEHEVRAPLRRRRRRRAAHPAAAVGFRHPPGGAGPLPQRPGADRLRRPAARRRAGVPTARRPRAATTAISEQSGVSWVPFTDDAPVPRPGDAAGCLARPAGGRRPFRARLDRRPGLVLRQGPAGDRPGRVRDDEPRRLRDAGDADRTTGSPSATTRSSPRAQGGRSARRPAARRAHRTTRRSMLPAGASLHYQGTTRMGADRRRHAASAPDSEVWGVAGLYVAGNGVIPTATAATRR